MSKETFFRFLKWSPRFKAGIEAPIVLVKVQFLWPIVNFCNENLLWLIAWNVGKAFKTDVSTLQVIYFMATSITVELDLRSSLPDRIWMCICRDGF